ncbi:MAG TPA: YihY/virulence factor BrkB family protein [Acidimicrobiales bacterium]|nr:YihY/virulence factor BrkB family protein [Acidimicrobiales bacterium]
MNPVERGIRRLDTFQQGRPLLAFLVAVVKKFGDDSAGSLAALIAYFGFLSLFPLLLVLLTVLGLVFANDPDFQHRVVNSTLSQFPIVGSQLAGPHGVHSLRAGSVAGLVIGLLVLIWGSLGVTQAAQRAMAEVWNVPQVDRPGFVPRMIRSIAFVGVLGLDAVVITIVAGFASFGGHSVGLRVAAVIVALSADVALYIVAFRVLTPPSINRRSLVPGAVIAGIAWATLQYLGSYLVGHQLRHSSQVYGYFASILGLIGFLYLASQITLYAAELNVVRARRLYPRSIVQPPLTPADERVLSDIAKVGERRPEQRVAVEFDRGPSGDSGAAAPRDPMAPSGKRSEQR